MENIQIISSDFKLSAKVGGETGFDFNGSLQLGRIRCDGFTEATALYSKFRRHDTEDGFKANFESEAVIPFGCEYTIRKQMTVCGNIATLTNDIWANGHGVVRTLELEDVFFAGPWSRLEYLTIDGDCFVSVDLTDETFAVESASLIVMVRLTAADGKQVEFACGSDLWRHQGGTNGKFILTGNAQTVTFKRQIFAFAADAAVERRPWRFKNIIAWSDGKAATVAAEQKIDIAKWPQDPAALREFHGKPHGFCAASPVFERQFRKVIRRSDKSLMFVHATSGFCDVSAHMERANKKQLPHFDLESLVTLYIWGNRQLNKQGKFMLLGDFVDTVFADCVIVKNMGKIPEKLIAE